MFAVQLLSCDAYAEFIRLESTSFPSESGIAPRGVSHETVVDGMPLPFLRHFPLIGSSFALPFDGTSAGGAGTNSATGSGASGAQHAVTCDQNPDPPPVMTRLDVESESFVPEQHVTGLFRPPRV
jgi:hypothetical protein